MKSTLGPWICIDRRIWSNKDQEGRRIDCHNNRPKPIALISTEQLEPNIDTESLANGFLISAAPELLAVCKALINDEEFKEKNSSLIIQAREAIEKAEGCVKSHYAEYSTSLDGQ